MTLNFEELSATRIDSLSRSETVFFFPVGPLEDHGAHLPVGLDVMEARRLCIEAGQRLEKEMPGWTGVVMPAAPLGIDSDTTRFALTVRAHVLRDWLVDACKSLNRHGFRHFVCFTGHLGPKQLTAIEEAGRMLNKSRLFYPFGGRRASFVSACSALVDKKALKSSAFWPDPEEHGARADTSLALSIAPDLVATDWAQLPVKNRETPRLKRFWLRLNRRREGYWGAPAEASAAHGNALVIGTVDEIFTKLRAVWEGANPEGLFRSWYSLFPTNKSFFKAWVAIILLAVLLAFWVYVVFEALSPMQ